MQKAAAADEPNRGTYQIGSGLIQVGAKISDRKLRNPSSAPKSASPRIRLPSHHLPKKRLVARRKVLEFLFSESGDKRLAARCAAILHGPICAYASNLYRLKVRRDERGHIYEYEPAGNPAVASLKRLERHAKDSSTRYHWTKAWAELTPAALKLIYRALPQPVIIKIGNPPMRADIRPVIRSAIQKAATPRVSTAERDLAVIAILRAFHKLYGTQPRNPKSTKIENRTLSFIAEIEKAYVDLLPNGFGVSRSKSALGRLIKLATETSVPNRP